MIPVEIAYYNVWAERLEEGIGAAYPKTTWLVLQHDELEDGDPLRVEDPRDGDDMPAFRLLAVKLGTGRPLYQDDPFTLVVDEGLFPFVVLSLGEVMEQRLAAMAGEERGGVGGD